MGAWDELDVIISAEVDVSDLDTLTGIDDKFGIFDSVKEYAEKLSTAIYKGSSDGVAFLSNFNRSKQEQYIRDNCKNPSGMLQSSIYDLEDNPLQHTIGTIINHIYPLSVEFGRGEVHPIPPKTRLRYYGEEGYLIYPKMAGKADPRPFVAPAYKDTETLEEKGKIMLREVAHDIQQIK